MEQKGLFKIFVIETIVDFKCYVIYYTFLDKFTIPVSGSVGDAQELSWVEIEAVTVDIDYRFDELA